MPDTFKRITALQTKCHLSHNILSKKHCHNCSKSTEDRLIIFPYKYVLHLRYYKYGITRCVAGIEMKGAIYTAKHVSVSFILFLISLGIFGWITIMKTCYIWFYTPFTHFDIKKSACMANFNKVLIRYKLVFNSRSCESMSLS